DRLRRIRLAVRTPRKKQVPLGREILAEKFLRFLAQLADRGKCRVVEPNLALTLVRFSATHVQRPLEPIDVLPLQTADLAGAHGRVEGQEHREARAPPSLFRLARAQQPEFLVELERAADLALAHSQ